MSAGSHAKAALSVEQAYARLAGAVTHEERIVAAIALADAAEVAAGDAARQANAEGVSWGRIAECVGVTRQSAWERWAKPRSSRRGRNHPKSLSPSVAAAEDNAGA